MKYLILPEIEPWFCGEFMVFSQIFTEPPKG